MMPIAIVALLSGLGFVRLPYEMLLLAQRAPILFPLHMVASAGALALLAPTIWFRHKPHLHRVLGRAVGVFVVVGGLTAIPVAVLSASSVWARAGFFVQGLVWLMLLGMGWRAILEKRRADHARLMLAMAAVTTGAVWFRLMIGTALYLKLPFETAYAIAAWVGWLFPLCAVLLTASRLGPAASRPASVRQPRSPVPS